MWSRDNYSSLGNSASLKFEIAFYPDDRSVYNCISINLHKGSKPWIAIKVDLNNHDAHDKLSNRLKQEYRLSFWKSEESQRSWIYLDLNSVDKSEAENVLSMINSVVPYDRSVYNCISINLHKGSKPWIAIKVDLNNHDAHDKLSNRLKQEYRLSFWKSEESQRSWIYLDLNSVDKSEAENVLSMINSVVPCTLAADAFSQAFSDILSKVIPTEKRVPWGQTVGLFSNSVRSLGEQVKSQMSSGQVSKLYSP